jgi:hypothetical protein
MPGLGLTQTPEFEVLATYSAPEQVVPAVEATPGWYVVGAFRMPIAAEVKAEVYGSVSDDSLTMRGRLFCITSGSVGPVSGSTATITSTTDVRALSGLFTLPAGDFQMQIEVTGDEGEELFGSLKNMTVIS